jgi:hypothetical protein
LFAAQLLPNTQAEHDEGRKADVNLSPDEIDEWLNLFNQTSS